MTMHMHRPLGKPIPLEIPIGYSMDCRLNFKADKFSRTKVCDVCPPSERGLNFQNMVFLEQDWY